MTSGRAGREHLPRRGGNTEDVVLTARAFRKFALEMPEAVEGSHMGHADFRVGGKVFASLGPDEAWAMVKLGPDDQADLVEDETGPYKPAAGAWGAGGSTIITLRQASETKVRRAVAAAWRNVAPKRQV
jgi:hypothetical protein